jgi:hypothetical protein
MESARASGLVGMHYSYCMQTKYPSLTKEDCELMLGHLEDSMAVFERKKMVLSASELRVKSLLSALRNEMRQHRAELADE